MWHLVRKTKPQLWRYFAHVSRCSSDKPSQWTPRDHNHIYLYQISHSLGDSRRVLETPSGPHSLGDSGRALETVRGAHRLGESGRTLETPTGTCSLQDSGRFLEAYWTHLVALIVWESMGDSGRVGESIGDTKRNS
jgi:hypothetical protein